MEDPRWRTGDLAPTLGGALPVEKEDRQRDTPLKSQPRTPVIDVSSHKHSTENPPLGWMALVTVQILCHLTLPPTALTPVCEYPDSSEDIKKHLSPSFWLSDY